MLLDYLLYYPSIDESNPDPQDMDNTNTLPRYTDGDGVQVMAVTLAARTGGQTFSFTYTNQDGVSGRVSQTARLNAYPAVGIISTCDVTAALHIQGPFIGLQAGDTGVRSIESVTMNGTDVGLFALILVKPITAITQGVSNPNSTLLHTTEKDLLESNQLPVIYDDAYLNFIAVTIGTVMNTTAHMGSLKVILD